MTIVPACPRCGQPWFENTIHMCEVPMPSCGMCGDSRYITTVGDRRAITYPCPMCHAQNSNVEKP